VLERNNKTKLLESIAILVADDIGYGVWAVSFPWEVVKGSGSGSRNRSARVAERAKKKKEHMFDVTCSSPLDFLFATCALSELKWEKTGRFIMGREPDPLRVDNNILMVMDGRVTLIIIRNQKDIIDKMRI
jgi:hypothetical protein